MKKALSLFLALALTLGVFCAVPIAELPPGITAKAANESDLYFKPSDDGESYYVADCAETVSGSLNIPSTYNGLPVTEIGDSAFKNCKDLVEVTIPQGVTDIQANAFKSCGGLTDITIPESVINIGKGAFYGCNNLKSVYITDLTSWLNITFPNYSSAPLNYADMLYINGEPATDIIIPCGVRSIPMFALSCANITSVVIPESVTSIGGSAFKNCTALTSVSLPDGLTYIGGSAFYGCTGLTSLTIPDSVTAIDIYAFWGCMGLTSITIPDSVTNIGSSAFYNCTGLNSVTIGDGVTSLMGFNFADNANLKNVIIGNGITSIDSSAFKGCTGLVSVTIPNSVKSIGYSAFEDCAGLTSVTIPGSVKNIGNAAFAKCTSLTSVTIPDSVISVGNSAFKNCTALTTVTIPSSIKSIGNSAFEDCAGLTSVTIPDSVTSVGNSAFKNCTALTTVTIPSSVKSIGNAAFADCTSLTSVTIPDSVTNIGEFAFCDCTGLISAIIGNGVTDINCSTFEGCDSLIDIVIPNSVTSVGISAFKNCTALTSVTIPSSVKNIGNAAFEGCTGLTSVIIPDSVTGIDSSAFKGCTALSSVILPDSEISISEEAFADTAYYNTPSNWENGVLYIGNHLIKAESEISGSYKVKDGTKTIAEKAFWYCSGLNSVTIPDGVIFVNYSAFCGCSDLKSVTIPNSVTTIGDLAFHFCDELSNVYYSGNQDAWNNISVDLFDNSGLKGANFHYGVTDPAAHWHLTEESPGCVFDGYRVYNCDCGYTLTERVLPVGHKPTDWITDKEPTCTVEGIMHKECTVCGEIIENGEIPATGHTSSGWITDKAATASAAGSKHKECTVCGTVFETAIIPQLKPSTPKLGTPSNTSTGVKLTWSNVDGADTYTVYRKEGNGSYKAIKTGLTNTSYIDTTAKSGTKYTYTVRATNIAGTGGYDKMGKSITYIAIPKPSAANANGGVTVKWSKVTGASGYYVYRKTGNGNWSRIANVTTTSYTDKTAKSGTTYKYTVKAYNGKTVSAYNTTGVSIKYLSMPKLTSVTNASNGVTVKWGKVTGAGGYYVYRKTGNGSWRRIAMLSGNSKVSYTDKTAKSGTTYKYTVRAYSGKTLSAYNTTGFSIKYLAMPTLNSVFSAKAGVTVKWSKVTGASGYYVYRKTGNGGWSKIATVSGNSKVSYLDKSAKKGTTYTYTVKAYSGKTVSAYNTTGLKIKAEY